MNKRILFEDKDIIAVYKQAGELVVADRWGKEARDNILLYIVGDYLRTTGHSADSTGRDLYPVHRLDRYTSGIVLFAKNQQMHRALSVMFENQQIEKTYWAFVEGNPLWDKCLFEVPIKRAEGSKGRGRALLDAQKGSLAVTEFRVRSRRDNLAWVEAYPKTGKLHQIRLHLMALGHPIINDDQYGTKNQYAELGSVRRPGPLLHARTLMFVHPMTSKFIKLESALDEDLRQVVGFFKAVKKVSFRKH